MANGAIIIDARSALLQICDVKIEDFAGSIAWQLDRVSPISTHTAGFSSDVFVLNTWHGTLTVNLQLGSASDNWLEQCSAAFAGLRQPWSISASREGEALFNTIISGPTTEPAIIMALDTQPTRSWVIGLSLKKPPKAGTFIVKTALTKAEVQAYVP